MPSRVSCSAISMAARRFPPASATVRRAPIIALSEERSLQQTLELFTAGIDDVVRKPVHVKELVVRADAVWRRVNQSTLHVETDEIKVYFDGRDPEVRGEPLPLPRRERHILEYLVKNAHRRVTKSQIFNAIYGIFDDNVDEVGGRGAHQQAPQEAAPAPRPRRDRCQALSRLPVRRLSNAEEFVRRPISSSCAANCDAARFLPGQRRIFLLRGGRNTLPAFTVAAGPGRAVPQLFAAARESV